MASHIIAELRFLIVEDEEFQREALALLLRNIGARHILQAEHGQAALDILKDQAMAVDIVLCDLDMPKMDGMALVRNLAKMPNHVSVILVSGMGNAMLDSVETMAKAYGVAVLGAMAKPPSRSKLLALIARHWDHGVGAQAPLPKAVIPKHELMHGLKTGEFVPYFQPKVEMTSGRVVGAEALARWHSPTRGLLAPGAFLEEIEACGLMDNLTWIILSKSAEVCRRWQEQGLELSVSVNLSLSSLGRIELAERISEVVDRHGLSPSSMVLEVTETAAMSAVGPSLENLARLRLRGFKLAIDDYGTGYSSLQQLTRVPFTELKIDQSFVSDAIQHDATRIVIESSLDIARKLGLQSTAEGIETLEHWEMLNKMGCDIAQGYLIAKPMPEEAVTAWMASWSPSFIQVVTPVWQTVDILLVEDEDFQRETYCELLEQLELGSVHAVRNVDEALAQLSVSPPDLVISDVNLGGRSGLDLVQLIRTGQTPLSPAIPILLLSSSSEQETVFKSIALDINGFLTKPTNSRALHEAILQALAEEFAPQPPAAYLGTPADATPTPHVSATILLPETGPATGRQATEGRQVSLVTMKAGMVLAEPIYTREKMLILGRGKTLTPTIINRLLDIRDSLASQDVSVVPAPPI